MSVLFISHSSLDNDQAVKVRDWLKTNGWRDVFLDLDPAQGLAPGHRWQEELKRAGENCAAVIVLISPNWVASRWCQTEFLVADQLGKRIFPVFIAPTSFDELPLELKAKFQLADISTPEKEAEGFQRLATGLKRAGLDPKSFEWPPADQPNRTVYRGLQALDVEDAAIFFGRGAAITQGLDELRRMRDGAAKRLMVILGASGAGKSSFLRAGLLSRLTRDEENFLPLPIIRPERAAVSGPQGLNASLSAALGQQVRARSAGDVAEIFASVRAPVVERLERHAEAGREIHHAKAPTIIVPLDQAEELFGADKSERDAFCEMIAGALLQDGNALLVATIRSDSYEQLQSEPHLAGAGQILLNLPPISGGSFQEIIEGPARLAKPPLTIEPALTQTLLVDLDAADALPLLAFTLERLQSLSGQDGKLTLGDYQDNLGGLSGAIQSAVDAALGDQPSQSELALARSLFIPALVQVDHDGVKRRAAPKRDLPSEAHEMVDRLVAQRLLVSDRDQVEVAHEAILRRWDRLAGWIEEERGALRLLEGVRQAAGDWRNNNEGEAWQLHRSGRLADAELLLQRRDFSAAFDDDARAYIAACRAAETRAVEGRRRVQRIVGTLAAATLAIALAGGMAVTRLMSNLGERASNTLAQMAERASNEGLNERAARYASAGLSGADFPLIGFDAHASETQLRRALVDYAGIGAPMRHEAGVVAIAFSPDGARLASASNDGTARLWNATNGAPIGSTMRPTGLPMIAGFSADGRALLTVSQAGDAQLWNAATGAPIGSALALAGILPNRSLLSPVGDILAVSLLGATALYDVRNRTHVTIDSSQAAYASLLAFSRDGSVLAVAGEEGVTLWDSRSGATRGPSIRVAGIVTAVEFSSDGTRLLTASGDVVRVWNWRTGALVGHPMQHEADVYTAHFSRDGSRVVTGTSAGIAQEWTSERGTPFGSPMRTGAAVVAAVFSPDMTRIATGSADETARLWDAETNEPLGAPMQHRGAITGLAFSPDGTRLATASMDGTARLWNVRLNTPLPAAIASAGRVRAFSVSDDGLTIATAGEAGAVVWSARSGGTGEVLPGAANAYAIALVPGENRLVTASERAIQVWDLQHRRLLRTIHETAGPSLALIAPDGMRVAIFSGVEDLTFFDSMSGARRPAASKTPDATAGVFSPNGARFAAALLDRSIHVFDVRTGREAGPAWQTHEPTRALVFSPDSTRIIVIPENGTSLRQWEVATHAPVGPPMRHDGRITNVAYSPDGSRLAALEETGFLRLWDMRTSAGIGAPMNIGVLTPFAFSPTGRLLASGDRRGHVRLWDGVRGGALGGPIPQRDIIFGLRFSPDETRLFAAGTRGVSVWGTPHAVLEDRAELARQACRSVLADGRSLLSTDELQNAPLLDPRLDIDTCRASMVWTRLALALGFQFAPSNALTPVSTQNGLPGEWHGPINQPGARAYSLSATFAFGADGRPRAEVEYPELSCSGSWTSVDANNAPRGPWRFTETIDVGARDHCLSEMLVEVSLRDNDHLAVRIFTPSDRQLNGSGVLDRERADQPGPSTQRRAGP